MHAECQTVLFARANHWLYLEQPEAFNAVLCAFAQGLDVRAALEEHSDWEVKVPGHSPLLLVVIGLQIVQILSYCRTDRNKTRHQSVVVPRRKGFEDAPGSFIRVQDITGCVCDAFAHDGYHDSEEWHSCMWTHSDAQGTQHGCVEAVMI
jgi:hypothetical protein